LGGKSGGLMGEVVWGLLGLWSLCVLGEFLLLYWRVSVSGIAGDWGCVQLVQ
jgi:hypothetical protein